MSNELEQFTAWLGRVLLWVGPWLVGLALFNGLAVFLSRQFGYEGGWFGPILLGFLSGIVLTILAWHGAAQFIKAFYNLDSHNEASHFLSLQMFGQRDFRPYLLIKEGKIAYGDAIVKKIGGPGSLIIYKHNAIVLERGGKLSRVVLGPTFETLESFEKVWDVIDLRPQQWVFPVRAITADGIEIFYDAHVHFQVKETEEDVFKAATCKWIRDAERNEPDRLMIWTKRVIISNLEGKFRSILAHYKLDQLLELDTRAEIQKTLEGNLKSAVQGLGARILYVALGNIKLEGEVLEQWFQTWQAERDRAVQSEILKGKVKHAQALEKARVEIRRELLTRTVQSFDDIAGEEEMSRNFVVLSLIEAIKKMSLGKNIALPFNVTQALDETEKRINQDI